MTLVERLPIWVRRNGRTIVAASALATGLLMRGMWGYAKEPYAGEAQNIAVALANGRGYADAYFAGSGATAHVMPLSPLLTATAYSLFGVRAPLAELLLFMIAMAEVIGAYMVAGLVVRQIGAPRNVALAGFVALCLMPVFISQEVLDFRYWEGGMGVFLHALVLLTIIRSGASFTLRQLIALSVLVALLCFVSPPLGLSACAILAVNIVRMKRWRDVPKLALGGALVAALLFGPWLYRNQETLGRPILLRSNLGLELSLGNNDDAPYANNRETFDRIAARYHPTVDGEGRAAYRRMGELRYYDHLLATTTAWIAADPMRSLELWAWHFRLMLVPSDLQFFLAQSKLNDLRIALLAIVSVGGLLGLGWAAVTRDRRFGYLLLSVIVVCLCYAPFLPAGRYLYLNYVYLMYGAALLAWMAARAIARRG